MANLNYEKLVKKIATFYRSCIIVGTDINGNIYVRIDKISVMSKKHLYIEDTGYGSTYEDACKNLISIYIDRDHILRHNKKYYATRKVRSIIRKFYKRTSGIP